MSAIKDMIAKLDAAKLQEEKDARERHEAEKRAWEEEQRILIEEEVKRLREEELERRKKLEEEKAKYHVDEEAAGDEVARLKREFLERNKKKEKPKEKVEIKNLPTIVIDVGSNTIKAGFAGEDAPRWVFSSIVGSVKNDHLMDLEKHAHIDRDHYIGDEAWAFKDVLDIRRTILRGQVRYWDDFGRILHHLFFEEMKLTWELLAEHPILLTEPPLNPKANREHIADILFNQFKVPAMYVANTSSLALFGVGRVTGIVVDIGYGVSTSVAVYDGNVIPSSLRRLDVGGYDLDGYLIRLMNHRGFRFNEMSIFDSFVIRDVKERHCYVAADFDVEMKRLTSSGVKSKWARGGNTVKITYDVSDHGNDMLPGFENKHIPDKLDMEMERFQCAESLFRPGELIGRDIKGIHMMIMETIASLAIDLKREMFANIMLSGGTTMLPGFADRLKTELRKVAAKSVEINVIETPTRHLAVWQGGSVIANAKHFNYNWVSREAYEADPKVAVH